VSVPGRHVGDPVRQGEVTAVRGSEAEPLYVVHWDDGHEGTCSPGAEARVAAPLRAVTGTLPGPDPLPDPLPPDPITPIGPPFPAPAPRPTDPQAAPPLLGGAASRRPSSADGDAGASERALLTTCSFRLNDSPLRLTAGGPARV